MTLKRLLPSVISIAILAGCASTAPAPATKPVTMASALADADAAAKAGRSDQAYAILKTAAAANPTDKAPWLRMAQMRFEDKNYGEAIVSGQQALERDPDDMLAYSLVAVSGLRVSSKALGDLTQKNGFSGSVRNEAQDLANLLHTTLKGERIVPPRAIASAPRPAAVRPAPAPAAKACSGPFCGLN
ncbi:MAG TPA: tetratricopeptide repeat protein [Telluria sp.]|nr:tetratricopeptide repeat protein [Telluria sp.]